MKIRGLSLLWRAALLTAAGCSSPEARQEIVEIVAPGPQDQTKPPAMGTIQRLALDRPAAPMPGTPTDDHAAFDYTLPTGWVELPKAQFRDVNLQVGGHPDTEIYLSVLPGGGGGLVENINRWARQMGAAALSAEAVDALPRRRLLGQEAALVTFSGTFTGMGPNATPKENYALIGLALSDGRVGHFLKMTGPAEVVQAESAHFEAFAASLRPHDHSSHAQEEQPLHDPAESAGGDPLADGLQWTAPPDWTAGPEKEMRIATFLLTSQPEFECYIGALGGGGGGVEANLNRWRKQMGQPEFSVEDVAALPVIPVLGGDAPLVHIEGDYTGMDGTAKPGYALAGIVRLVGSDLLFVKMTGPAAVVSAQMEAFTAFCKSLR